MRHLCSSSTLDKLKNKENFIANPVIYLVIFILYHLCCQQFLIHLHVKTFQKRCKIANKSICQQQTLLADSKKFIYLIASFSFYVALITKKYVSIENRVCFKKDLLMARDQLPNYTENLFPLFISLQNNRKGPLIPLKSKMFKV